MKNGVQLITYVDRLSGGGFAELAALLRGPLRGLFAGVHVLPFFDPIDAADAGFDPRDHTRVDPRLGDWSDVAALAAETDVMADLIVNHISRDSPQFRDFLTQGAASPFAELFLTRERVFPHGATDADLQAIYRPRPGLPFTEMTVGDGDAPPTVDDVHAEPDRHRRRGMRAAASTSMRYSRTFAASGVRIVRLDAVGYAIKKAGTSCFMIPETFELIAELSRRIRALGMETLVEIHSHYREQIEIAKHVDWVYDFALPPLVLHAFAFGTARPLAEWLRVRPRNALTVLDTHDGIGIVDIGARAWRAARAGPRAAARARPARRDHPRRERRLEPARDGRGRVEPRSLSGQLHVLRRARARRPRLSARARNSVLRAGRAAGLLRRACSRATTTSNCCGVPASGATSTGTTTRATSSTRRCSSRSSGISAS